LSERFGCPAAGFVRLGADHSLMSGSALSSPTWLDFKRRQIRQEGDSMSHLIPIFAPTGMSFSAPMKTIRNIASD
jgi:hypothetical protein